MAASHAAYDLEARALAILNTFDNQPVSTYQFSQLF